jgi:putative peptidoglycan lipid II flippase
VVAATALLSVFLLWTASQVQWVGASVHDLQRLAVLALVLLGSAVIYFGALWATGLNLRAFVRR